MTSVEILSFYHHKQKSLSKIGEAGKTREIYNLPAEENTFRQVSWLTVASRNAFPR
jgi:hypothetical protein